MPLEESSLWPIRCRTRHLKLGSMKRIVSPPVLVVFAQARAHLEPELRRNRHVPSIEQTVEVRPQQQPVSDLVRALLSLSSNVGRLKGRQRALSCYRAASTVRIEDRDTECRLPEPGLYQTRAAVARAMLRGQRNPDVRRSPERNAAVAERSSCPTRSTGNAFSGSAPGPTGRHNWGRLASATGLRRGRARVLGGPTGIPSLEGNRQCSPRRFRHRSVSCSGR